MNKIHQALFLLFVFFVGHEAYATACDSVLEEVVSLLNTTHITPTAGLNGCASTSVAYYTANAAGTRFYKVTTCLSCAPNFKMQFEHESATPCSFTLQYCTPCTGCTDCTSTSWTTALNGIHQSQTLARCIDECSNTCEKTTAYRCLDGYYGTPTNTTTGCYKCPTSGGLSGTSIPGQNLNINECYFPRGRSVTDSSGTYQFTSNCFYSN